MNIKNPLYIKKFNSILDIGCGDSSFAETFTHRNIYLIDKVFCKLTSNPLKLKSKTLCINGDVLKLPFKPKSIDLILCKKVLHHLQNLQSVKNEILRIMKINGYFFLIDIIVDVEDAYYNCASYIKSKNHIRYYRVNEIFDLFKEHFRLLFYYNNTHEVFFDDWLQNCHKEDRKEIESTFIELPSIVKKAIKFKSKGDNPISFFRKEGHFLFQRLD
mgnify:CR=1 FL=1